MNDLEQYREALEKITREMLELMESRLNLSRKIADYKYSHQMAVFQPEREKMLIEKLAVGPYANQKAVFLQTLFDLSKEVQKAEIEKK